MSSKNELGGSIRDLPRTGLGDKVDHAIAGTVVFGAAYFLANKTGTPYPEIVGLVGTTSVAISIEVLQRITRSGVFDWWDFAATVAPAILLTGVIYLIR